jgi:hypothetical protein
MLKVHRPACRNRLDSHRTTAQTNTILALWIVRYHEQRCVVIEDLALTLDLFEWRWFLKELPVEDVAILFLKIDVCTINTYTADCCNIAIIQDHECAVMLMQEVIWRTRHNSRVIQMEETSLTHNMFP